MMKIQKDLTDKKEISVKSNFFKLITLGLILLIAVPAVASDVLAQSVKVKIVMKNSTVAEVIREFHRQTGYEFSYDVDILNKRVSAVSVDVKSENVEAVLKQIFEGTDIDFKIVNNRVFLKNSKTAESAPGINVNGVQQQGKTVAGVVVDNLGEPVIGATVVVRGDASKGTVTDIDGKFTLTNAPENAILDISYVGMKTQTVDTAGKTSLNIALVEDSEMLEELVVVGYGVQKKVNLTGAVATATSEKLENRATTNLSSSLSGLASGVTVSQGSGKPGSDGASIRIRGVGTFNGSYLSPLVIVDGAEASINSVNSEDVESISFLKDAASAAIYGSRGANGVLLITTKRGKKNQVPKITYTGLVSNIKASGKAFRFESNYAEYMEMANRWYTNSKWDAATKYTLDEIKEWKEALQKDPNSTDNPYGVANYLAYPSTQWTEHLFKANTTSKHNLSIIGGGNNSNYLVSLGFLDNPGTLENTGLKNYSGRINLETKLSDFLEVGTMTYANFEKTDPGNTSLSFIFQNTPAMTPYHDGMYGVAVDNSSANNLLATVVSKGGANDATRLNTTWFGKAEILKGLTAEYRFNYQTLFNESATFDKKVDKINFRTGEIRPGVSSTDATTTRSTTRYWNRTQTATLNYLKSIDDHDIAVLAGAEQYYWNVKGFSATRTGLLDLSLPDFTAALDKLEPRLGGTAEQDYAVASLFGRINYAYKQRYLLELNVRRDGSSRFGPDYRWGTFPSVSAAWRISEEDFMKDVNDAVSNLKLRASWGQLGNTTSGYYEWQATYGSVNYSFDGNVYDGLRQGKIANPLLHWEAVTSGNIGVDAGFIRNKLTLELDFYSRLTKGILASPSVYLSMGTIGAPTTNTSDMQNKGIEVTLGWNDKVDNFRYNINGNFTYNNNSIVKYKGKFEEGWSTDSEGNKIWTTNRGDVADVSGNTIRVEDHIFDEYYVWQRHKGNGNVYLSDGVTPDPNGGPRDGMIRTKNDLDWVRAMLDYKVDGKTIYNFNNQSVGQGAGLWYGEAIYADLNGDGMYGTNDNDRYFTGKSSIPKYTFGLNLSAEWKGIDLSMTWAGAAGMYHYIYERGFNSMSSSSWQEGTIVPLNARQIFYYSDPEKAATDPNYDPANDSNANINSPYLRIGNVASAFRATDVNLYNASYVKLKSLQVGYSFPSSLISKAKISKLRVFVTGENLFTITSFPGVDPEIGGGGFQSYPIPRMLSGGINLTF